MTSSVKQVGWVLRRHYGEDGELLLVDTAPANAALTTPLGEYSNMKRDANSCGSDYASG